MKYKMFFLIVLIFLCSCTSSKYVKSDFFSMDTYMTVDIKGSNDDIDSVKKEIFRLNTLLKKNGLNMYDSDVKSLIKTANDISSITDGSFDITTSKLSDLWGFYNNSHNVPSHDEILKELENVGYDKMKFDDNISIDLGGIAKGYAGDMIYKMLKERNVSSGIISLGGNIIAIGEKNNSEKWSVGIVDPTLKSDYVGYVKVADKSVITSGGYERFFEKDGVYYHHILDPKTGYPANSDLSSVTVISESGTTADALSTAFYVMGYEKVCQFLKDNNNIVFGYPISVILILNNNEIKTFGDVEFIKK